MQKITLAKRISTLTFLGLVWVATAPALAQDTLSAEALYYRCFRQMAALDPESDDPLLVQVKARTLGARNACLQVLRRALLTEQNETRIASLADTTAIAVLHNFHKLHSSWFLKRELEVGGGAIMRGTKDLFDSSAPALYFTRALFKPGAQVRRVLVGDENLRAVRSQQNPMEGPASADPKTDHVFGTEVRFAPMGKLLGVEETGDMATPYSYTSRGEVITGTWKIGDSRGGGVLGTGTYLLLNVAQEGDFQADGVVEMPRMWAKAIYHDFLCRELPVIRLADAERFVVVESDGEFRLSAGCVRCHASQDRMAATIRNFTYKALAPSLRTIPGNGAILAEFLPTTPRTHPAEPTWPAMIDPGYYARPTNGVLYYRNYRGRLVNVSGIPSVQALGQEIVDNHDDFYICAAKRYYQYFTGVDVDIGDLAGLSPSGQDMRHRDQVIALGVALRGHQSLLRLVGDIINLPAYAQRDFGQ